MSNLSERLRENAQKFPQKAVFIYPGPGGSWRQVSYQDLWLRSNLLARGLARHKLKRGTRAVLMLPPSLDFFALVFALLQTGIVPVMVDPAIGMRNVTRCLAETGAELYFGNFLTDLLRRIFGWGRGSLRLNLSIAGLKRAAGGAFPDFAPIAIPPEAEAAIVYTSGSTGLPKGAIYTHANFSAQIDMLVNAFDLRGDEIDLPAFPLFALIDCLLGVTAVIPDVRFPRPARIDPALITAAVQSQRVDTLFASPVVLDRLAQYGRKTGVRLPGLKRIFTAGAPAPVAVQKMFREMLSDKAGMSGVYGSTEALPVAIISSLEILQETRYLSARGAGVCIGRPADDVQVRIIPISTDAFTRVEELPRGEIGEIAVSGAAVTTRYVGREETNRLAKIEAPTGMIIHRMGDVGYFDKRGRLWYCGRMSQRVETPTGRLFTEQVEGIFNTHPLVYRTALVGVRRGELSEPVLWVELLHSARGTDKEQMRAELLALAQDFDVARSIRTILFHPAFPTDVRHNSKIIREELARQAQTRLT